MSGVALTYKLDDAAWIEQLDSFARMGNLKPALRTIGQVVRGQVLAAFKAEESPDGNAWEQSVRALEQEGRTLQDTGDLRNSITSEVYPEKVMVGTNVVYAAVHNFGGKAGRNLATDLPARTFMPDEQTIDKTAIEASVLKLLHRIAR